MTGFTMQALRVMHQAACDYDPRLVWDGSGQVGIVGGDGAYRSLGGVFPRQLRLLASQLNALADRLDDDALPVEEVDVKCSCIDGDACNLCAVSP